MSPTIYTYAEVAKHNTEKDLWMVIEGKVYDVTAFADEHPGGVDTLLDVAGMDGTEAFDGVGHSDSAKAMLKDYYKGDISEADKASPAAQKAKAQAGPSSVAVAVAMVLLGIVLFLIFKQ